MSKLVVVTGKGGVGKTLVAGGLIKYFSSLGFKLLGVDADPDSNLAQILGHSLELTLGQVREQILRREPGTDLRSQLQYLVMRCLMEHEGYDLIAMGRSEGPDCYCAVNHLLRDILDKLIQNYHLTIVDCQAGLEQISRRTIRDIDAFLVVMDPSLNSFQTASRILEITKEINLNFNQMFLIGNKIQDEDQIEILEQRASQLGLELLGWIPYDRAVLEMDLRGENLDRIHGSKAWNALEQIASSLKSKLGLN